MADRRYLVVESIDERAGFCRIDIGARPEALARDEELRQIEEAFIATTPHGRVLVECDSPLSLPPTCLADISHFYQIWQIWERHGAPALTFLSPAPIIAIILRTIGVRYTVV